MNYFITGIGTDVGKSIASAVVVEALEADYWKPIQSGDLDNSDTMKIKKLVSNSKSIFHPECHRLITPASPHLAAKIDGVDIHIDDFELPKTDNHLIIEGAGGILVPINEREETILDLITYSDAEVILVSRHYLGSINHTLLSINQLKQRNVIIKGIIFIGDENEATESIIQLNSGINVLGRIPMLDPLNQESIKEVAQQFKHLGE